MWLRNSKTHDTNQKKKSGSWGFGEGEMAFLKRVGWTVKSPRSSMMPCVLVCARRLTSILDCVRDEMFGGVGLRIGCLVALGWTGWMLVHQSERQGSGGSGLLHRSNASRLLFSTQVPFERASLHCSVAAPKDGWL
jgi:hypothetical protein